MGLTLEVEHLLKRKGFDKLYEDHTAKWVEMAAKAKEYTESCISDGEKVRPGDISENLQNALKIDPTFEEHFGLKKLTQKYWVRHYSDYILDRIYPVKIEKKEAKVK